MKIKYITQTLALSLFGIAASFIFSPMTFALLSGILALFSFFIPTLSFFVLIPVIIGMQNTSVWSAILFGIITMLIPSGMYVAGIVPFTGGKIFETGATLWLSLLFGGAMALLRLLSDGKPTWSLFILVPFIMMAYTWISELPLGKFSSVWNSGVSRIPWVLHLGNLGSHLIVVAYVSFVSVLIAFFFIEQHAFTNHSLLVLAGAVIVLAGVIYGNFQQKQIVNAIEQAPKIRVAAVASDLGVHDIASYLGKDKRSDYSLVVKTYNSLIQSAAAQGAKIIVLPEAHIFITEEYIPEWKAVMRALAKTNNITIVAGYYHLSAVRNLIAVFRSEGSEGREYEKQHPTPLLEPKAKQKMRVGFTRVNNVPLSYAICYDMNFSDITSEVRSRNGIFALPSNDWNEVAEKHHQLSQWASIESKSTLIRATSHGISSITTPDGTLISRASSFNGDVVLVADVPAAF